MAGYVRSGPLYLDSNVLIYSIEAGNPWTGQLEELLARLYRGELDAVTSELTLAEVLPKPLAKADRALVEAYETLLSESSPLTIVPVDRSILHRSAGVRSVSRMKLADAIHTATALQAGCTRFLSNDGRLLAALPPPLLACGMDQLPSL